MMTPLLHLPAGPAVLAFDVGGTDIKSTVVTADGVVHQALRTPTPAPSAHLVEDILQILADCADTLRGQVGGEVAAAGLALPGIVDDDAGIAVDSENLRWHDVPFRELAAKRLAMPVALAHDVRASALAELTLGAAQGATDALVVTIGTGIAAGVIVDGRVVVRGGYAGEMGHAVVRPGGQSCLCGNRGCLEATASAAAIARRYFQATGVPVPGAREVLQRVDADPTAREIWDDAVDALAFGLSHVCALLAPQRIVLAGGLSEAGDALLVPLQARLDAYFPIRTTPIVRSRLGGDAGVVGAALRARAALEPASRTAPDRASRTALDPASRTAPNPASRTAPRTA